MAPAYFLRIDGIEGKSSHPEHAGELELASFTWGESAPPPDLPTTVSFTLLASRATPELFAACASGRRIAHAVLTMRERRGPGTDEVRRWRFSDVVVTTYTTAGSADEPLDQVSLAAAELVELAPPARPALRLRLVRPDDLLNLEIEAVNLRLDTDDPADPALVVDEPAAPARLVVLFPAQTIAETAYFESPPFEGEVAPPPPGEPPEPDPAERPLDPPGAVGPGRDSVARIADSSRLVFDVPTGTRIPLTFTGLLDWSALEPAVSPIAAIPPDPTDDQISSAPAIRPPEPTETALELPYRLVVSPNKNVSWGPPNAAVRVARPHRAVAHTTCAPRRPGGSARAVPCESGPTAGDLVSRPRPLRPAASHAPRSASRPDRDVAERPAPDRDPHFGVPRVRG